MGQHLINICQDSCYLHHSPLIDLYILKNKEAQQSIESL